ncbi:LANO_0E00144g1_1 [Lachancea nothofagi CBS 11611]|uniref:LANO_0E00144g1_1 n=1 Tax=Lachancea nothofagi CBS 11611 TaxID=1266666 RepID=A0A1G4JNX3_9SACH|nr:LANO_0E00144g1_1 [Lachancea nothofagi CBS 11611]
MAFGIKLSKGLQWTNVTADKLNLKSLRVAIIGGTGGIGQSFSRLFQSKGAEVIVVGRTFKDGDLKNVQFIKADLDLMSEARRVSQELAKQPLDLVIFTTGIFAAPTREETAEGLERDMAVSYLSRLVIIRGILPTLEKNSTHMFKRPRVFIVGFPGTGELGKVDDLNSEGKYSAMQTHMTTVAGNEALVLDSAQRYPKIGLYGLNPGLIKTSIRNNFLGADSWKSWAIEGIIGLWCQNAEQYALRMLPMMVSSDLEAHSPAFFNNKAEAIQSQKFTEPYVKEFIGNSEELVRKSGIPLD